MTKNNKHKAVRAAIWSILLLNFPKKLWKFYTAKRVFLWKTVLVAGLSMSFLSCKELFQFSPNEIRLQEREKNLNVYNIERITSLEAKDTFRFVVMGDTQRFYEEVEDFVEQINRLPDIAFVVLAGDISDFGLAWEFSRVNERLRRLTVPYLSVIGNHDMLSNGREVYRQMYGAENFSFTLGSSKFVCLNTNSNEQGFDGSIPDMRWLRKELAGLETTRNIFVVSHMAPFHEGFDPEAEQEYASLLAGNSRVCLSIHAHQHFYSLSQPYGDGMEYLVVGGMGKRNYALVTVEGEHYRIEEHYY